MNELVSRIVELLRDLAFVEGISVDAALEQVRRAVNPETRLDPDAVGRDFDHLWSCYVGLVAELDALRAKQ